MPLNNKNIYQFVFVGGCQRSGTTLLQAILNSHKRIYAGPEFGYLKKICELRNYISRSTNSVNKLDVYFNRQKLDEIFKEFITNLLKGPCIGKGKDILCEKSPNNIMAFDTLSMIFPESKFIFVIRDPRAIYSSIKDIKIKANNKGEHKPQFSKNITLALKHINAYWKKGFQFSENNKKRIIIIAYEDLINSPKETTMNLCKFLEIDWDPNMLNHNTNMGDIISQTEKSIWGGSEMYRKDIHSNSLNKWKKNLKASEILLIEKETSSWPLIRDKYFESKIIDKKQSQFNIEYQRHILRSFLYDLRPKVVKTIKKVI